MLHTGCSTKEVFLRGAPEISRVNENQNEKTKIRTLYLLQMLYTGCFLWLFVNIGLGPVEKYNTFVLVQFAYFFITFSIFLIYLSLECVFFLHFTIKLNS